MVSPRLNDETAYTFCNSRCQPRSHRAALLNGLLGKVHIQRIADAANQ
jgi:hypothetical protein